MWKRRKRQPKNTRQDGLLDINGQQVPVRIYREDRRNVRASIGKEYAYLRMPHWQSKAEQEKNLQWFRDWLSGRLQQSEGLSDRLSGRQYEDGELLRVGQREYRLLLKLEDRKTHSAKLQPDGSIVLKLSSAAPERDRSKAIQKLLSRVVAQDYLPAITRRVHELNERYFRQPVNQVRLKYNHSNWGSCSNNSNINLSTRLLFAPQEVIDYVIIHELAHLLEMNHSPRFWKLVSDAMPDYREKEIWLKEHGRELNF